MLLFSDQQQVLACVLQRVWEFLKGGRCTPGYANPVIRAPEKVRFLMAISNEVNRNQRLRVGAPFRMLASSECTEQERSQETSG